MNQLAAALLLAFTIQQGLSADPTASERKPWIGQPGGTKQWLKRHFAQDAQFRRMRTADLVFVGDSLTDFWSSMGKPVWTLEFEGLKIANAGISADRTQQIVWRMLRGHAIKLGAKGYVVMAGTNNLAMNNPDSPEDVAKGVEGIIRAIQRQSPGASVLVLSILPNSDDPDLAKRIQQTNTILKNRIPELDQIEFLDLWPVFSDKKGRLKPNLTVDGTHLTQEGYDLLANEIRPIWHRWLGR